jgi:hypothetical protein
MHVKFTGTDSTSCSWQVADISEGILRIKNEIDVELHGDDQSWVRNDSAVSFPLSPICFVYSIRFIFSIDITYLAEWLSWYFVKLRQH